MKVFGPFGWVCSWRRPVRGAQLVPAARHLHPGYLCLRRPGPPALPAPQPPVTCSKMPARTGAGHFLAVFLPYSLLGCFQTLPSLSPVQAKPCRNTQGRNPLAGVAQNAWSGPSPRAVPGAQRHRVSPRCPGCSPSSAGNPHRPHQGEP